MDVSSYLVSARFASDIAVLVFLKSSVVVVSLALATHLLRNRSAAIRHRIWESGLLALVLLPVLEFTLPQWRIQAWEYPAESTLIGTAAWETRPTSSPFNTDITTREVQSWRSHELPLASVLLIVWWTGVLVAAVAISSDQLRAFRLKQRSISVSPNDRLARILRREQQRMNIERPVKLLLVPDNGLAATIGTLCPKVVLGRDVASLPDDQIGPILIHELAHVKRRDYLSFLLSRFTAPLYWPNPMVWWARRMSRLERERACDDMVLVSGIRSPHYARVLLDFALSRPGLASSGSNAAFLRFSPTKSRIHSILQLNSDRRPIGVMSTVAVLAVCICIGMPTGSLKMLTSQPGTGTVDDLNVALYHSTPAVRARAARTLGRRDASGSRVALESLLDDESAEVRLAAIGGLEQLADPRSLPALAHVLERPFDGGRGEHGFVLKYAMFALGKMGSPEAISILEQQLHRPVGELRMLALEIIAANPAFEEIARKHLTDFVAFDPSPENRERARKLLNATRTPGSY